MADGNITFSTSLDNTRLFKDLKEAESNLTSLKKKLEGQQFERSWLEKMMDRASDKADNAKAKVDELTEKIRSLEAEQSSIDTDDMNPAAIERWRELGDQVLDTYRQLNSAHADYDASMSEWEGYGKKWDVADAKARSYEEAVEAAEGRQRELSERVAETATESQRLTVASSGIGNAMASGMQTASSLLDKVTSKIGSMLKQAFVFGVAMKGLQAISKGISTALMQSERFSASWTRLTATVTGVANAISDLVAPALSGMVDAVASAIENLARLIDSVLGTSFADHIREARAAAEASWRQGDAAQDAADSLQDQADATSDLADAEDEARRSVLGFDEINALQAQTADDNASSLGDEAGALGADAGAGGGGAKPSWDALDVGKISEKLAEIMLVLGAALMAVGAILAFSGINIPLGITLMVIGALMIYAAYKEQWDKLPAEVRQAITTALVITGIVLLVLGAVLAFSGINIPLGIGMMAAGAVLLWTALALNWQSMSPQVQNAITLVGTVVSAALLVIGAILAFTGINVPLGIGMMALGAVGLAALAILNWEYLKANFEMFLPVIEAAVAGFALLLGACLLFTGVNVPLGLALVAAGAVGLAVVAVANWAYIQEHMDEVLPLVEAAIAGFMLVLGAVLLFTGAHPVVGLGLLAAGAILLGKEIAENWDYLKAKFEEVLPIVEGPISGALLVLGAILLFTGASAPLGLGLLVAGAVGLREAVDENWNKIPEDVRGVIATLELALGFAFLVIGSILLFTAANIPLGLGLVAVGALAMGDATEAHWGDVPEQVRGIIATLELALGAAFLVVGAILVFSAVNIPLGLVLLAGGALAMGDASTARWNDVPDQVKAVIAVIEAALSVALLVIGIILCFAGVSLPLGLALMAAGAFMLAHQASEDWGKMPAEVQNVVTQILTIAGAALLVIGIILCFTGVGIPLGVALILAGAASLATAVAINWDFITEKVREAWESVKRFWDDNIAHVFTWEFWEGVFKSIVNGLISALNSGLGAFGDFVNSISSGIGSILSGLGVSGWSFTFYPPQIPYLAQGAVIPPNREFMAVLGDQRYGNNIEAPEALMRQVVREEAGAMMADLLVRMQGAQGQQGGDVTLVLRVDSEELSRAVSRGNASRVRRGEAGLVGIDFV